MLHVMYVAVVVVVVIFHLAARTVYISVARLRSCVHQISLHLFPKGTALCFDLVIGAVAYTCVVFDIKNSN